MRRSLEIGREAGEASTVNFLPPLASTKISTRGMKRQRSRKEVRYLERLEKLKRVEENLHVRMDPEAI